MTSPQKRIIGIDPGSHRLGLGCLIKNGNSLKLVCAETIQAPPKRDLYTRLEVIQKRLLSLFDELSPEEVALEDTFYGKNVRSAFQLGIVRGMVFSACFARSIRIFEYAPAQVKSVVTGYGRADKAQVEKMVNLLLGTKIEAGFDATDAVAIAICHASIHRLNWA